MVKIIEHEFNGVTFKIKIGKNSKENWEIIESAKSTDYWFHLGGDRPSCHVILEIPKDATVNNEVIKHCCVLCKSNTNKFKSEKNVPVIYTQVINVSFGEKEGQVYTINTKTITI